MLNFTPEKLFYSQPIYRLTWDTKYEQMIRLFQREHIALMQIQSGFQDYWPSILKEYFIGDVSPSQSAHFCAELCHRLLAWNITVGSKEYHEVRCCLKGAWLNYMYVNTSIHTMIQPKPTCAFYFQQFDF